MEGRWRGISDNELLLGLMLLGSALSPVISAC